MRQKTVSRLAIVAAHVIVLGGTAVAHRADAAPAAGLSEARADDSRQDRMIERAFQDELGRAPHDDEYRRYRRRISRDDWTERDIREDLRSRDDYRSANSGSGRASSEDVDKVIRRAYEDVLGRAPDTAGLRLYRSRMIDDGWTEHQVRDALRDSPEHKSQSSVSADRIIRRAYEDILGREPDQAGLNTYRRHVMDEGWDEHDVRDALKKSPENRQKAAAATDAEAAEIVRRAYLSVLGREPDAGSASYKARVIRDHWTEADIARELRKSAEYRSKH